MRKRGVGTIAAICVALGLVPAAHASPTWRAATTLSESDALLADTAMGSGGGAAVTWLRPFAGHEVVEVATRAPFASFSPAVDLPPAGGESRAPQVAEDAAGNATVVWSCSTGSNFLIEAATVASGIPSPPVQLSEPGQNATFPAIAVNERGDAVVAWRRSNGVNEIVQASFRPAGGSFGAPVNLSPKGRNADLPRVAIDAAGDATVVWDSTSGGPEVVEEATRSAATSSFAEPAELSNAAEPAQEPVVAMDAAGDAAVAWIRWNGSHDVVQATTRPAGASGFGAVAEQLSLAGTEALSPEIATDGRGDPTVVWWLNTEDVQVSTGTPSGVFPATPETLAPFGVYPNVAEDAAGDTVIGYVLESAGTSSAAASFRPAGGQFTVPQEVSPAGQRVFYEFKSGDENGLNVAMDGDGDGMFGFSAEEGGGGYFAQASLLDATGPVFKSVSIPATATAGVPVAFAAAPVDQVSEPSTTSWSFGDASTASGASVTHVFANPGSYTVSVTATDAVGNPTTQTGTIAVAAPIAPGVPAFDAATLGSGTVTADRHGRVRLKVACPVGGAACTGTVALTLPATASSLAVAARAKGIAVTVAAGHVSFSAAPGASATVSISLPAAILKLLVQRHRLTLTATVETHGGTGQLASRSARLVVKAPAKPRKPRRKKKR